MSAHELLSDQLNLWSVKNDRADLFSPQATPQATAAQDAAAGRRASGLLDRTLQALRQSKLQVRRGSRTRTQVLPLGELLWQVASNGLRPPGRARAGLRALGQLRPSARDLGG